MKSDIVIIATHKRTGKTVDISGLYHFFAVWFCISLIPLVFLVLYLSELWGRFFGKFLVRYFLPVILLLILPGVLFAQTNYPPNSAPWNNHPTNWVYDCEFLGYGNIDLNATPLACGWYDEPMNVLGAFVNYVPLPVWTNLFISSITVTHGSASSHGITFVTDNVNLQLTNFVAGSSYTLYGTFDFKTWYLMGNFSVDSTGAIVFSIPAQSCYFFKVYGLVLPAPQIFAARINSVLSDPSIQLAFNAGMQFSATVCVTLYGFSFLRLTVPRRKEEL